MCDRYFITFPPQPQPLQARRKVETAVSHSHKTLKTIRSSEVKLHEKWFFKALWPNPNHSDCDYTSKGPDNILRQNVFLMAKETKQFGLLFTQCHWSGLLTLQQGTIMMSEPDELSCRIVLYRMLLQNSPAHFDTFINALHMTGNQLIANVIEARFKQFERELLEDRVRSAKEEASTIAKKRKGTTHIKNESAHLSKQPKRLQFGNIDNNSFQEYRTCDSHNKITSQIKKLTRPSEISHRQMVRDIFSNISDKEATPPPCPPKPTSRFQRFLRIFR